MSQIRWFGWLGVGVLASTLAAFVLHSAAHGSSDASLLAQRIALGKQLFNDPSLSADGTVRCASCHIPEKAYADGRATAVGVYGRVGTRNTPSLLAVETAKEGAFFWDGRRTALEHAVLDPLTNPVEMGLRDQTQVMQRIAQNNAYRPAFAQAFPTRGDALTPDEVGVALATYIRSLNPSESAFDRYGHGDRTALNPRAQLGLALFQGKAGCAECHRLEGASPTFTDHAYHRTGVGLDGITANLPALTESVIARSLQGSAIGDRVATHADEAQLGRFNVTLEPADIGLFRTPSLRDVSRTAPYMHDGSVPTLEDAIDREVYYRSLQAGRPLNLSVEERLDLAEFLRSL
ncbi:cytochrome-c peroxidase [Burkholderia pseudomallei]|uniref:cytochrome-c peroxidase n=1 Tax=Burkholderia pseudomallei TaxID=28450 RepID=UPI001AD6C5E6|nr:cytochrome c peroxidase [Burkholderia pseudomallei]MBO7795452.1 cytochrome c family protein [Burkholderia pseudomallei]MBO7814005.1 cytochrome c family protein [Burkholderia pseudomallei]